MRVWVTRAEPGAARTASALRGQGHAPLVAPLLQLEVLAASAGDPELEGAAALAFTSAAGVEAFAALSPRRRGPVFAVGDATAAAAWAHGFEDVRSADGDGAALARRILADRADVRGRLLAPGALRPAFDLAAALAPHGIETRRLPLYASHAATRLPAPVEAALQARTLDAALVHSPAAARALADLAAPPPGGMMRALRAFALSEACAEPLRARFAGRLTIADAPREERLLATLCADGEP